MYRIFPTIGKCLFSAITFPSNVTLEPTYYFMSDCPSEYVIKFTCAYSSTITNGYCNGHYTVYIELTANPPDSVPWYKIENELYKKLGLRMNEPINKLLYRGEGMFIIFIPIQTSLNQSVAITS